MRDRGNQREVQTSSESSGLTKELSSLNTVAKSAEPKARRNPDESGRMSAVDPDDVVLVLREVFKTHVHAGRVRSAHAIARKMVRHSVLSELTHADLARACIGLGWWMPAAQAFRLAARFAPARRRAMHWAACANALLEDGRHEEAVAALERALRWSTSTRPLHRAHIAMIRLERGVAVDDIDSVMTELQAARCGEGYGRYILGRLHLLRNELEPGLRYLREFIARNAPDPMRALTLRAELIRARRSLRVARQPTISSK